MDDCLLCRAEHLTTWHYEDAGFWICDCLTCGVPLAVMGVHALGPMEGMRDAIERELTKVANARYGPGNWYYDFEMRGVKDHWHCHARPR